jgi:hypothetical protein
VRNGLFTLSYDSHLVHTCCLSSLGPSDLLSASEDVSEGVMWFWELRDPKKSLHTSTSHTVHTSALSPAPLTPSILAMTAKDAARAKKMIDLTRKRRKDLSILVSSMSESSSLLSLSFASTFQPSKSFEGKLLKSLTKYHKSRSLDEIEESMTKGLEELGGKYQAQAQALKLKMEEKEAKKIEREAKKVEKFEEKKISKSGFGDKKSLDSARRVMTQFFGKTPLGKAPASALAITPAGERGGVLSPEGQVMPPPPPPGLGSAGGVRSTNKGLRAGPFSHTPQE